MKTLTRLLFLSGAIALIASTTGCRTVSEGPTAPSSGGSAIMRGEQPKPTTIKTKDVPEGESSLRHSRPDKS
jgi:hypothetical protein